MGERLLQLSKIGLKPLAAIFVGESGRLAAQREAFGVDYLCGHFP